MVTATRVIRTPVKAAVLIGLISALALHALYLSLDVEPPGQDDDDEFDY